MSGECNICGEMGHAEANCPEAAYAKLASSILDLVSDKDDAGCRWGYDTSMEGVDEEAVSLIREWAEKRLRKPPEEVLLSEEFLTKFAEAFYNQPVPTALSSTRVESEDQSDPGAGPEGPYTWIV